MTKRIRRIVIVALCLIIGVPVLMVLVPIYPDATPHSKIAEVFLSVSTLRTSLAERCTDGALSAGMTHESLGLPDPYKPDRFVKYVTVQVETPERFLVSAYLEDIFLDILFWKELRIPEGAKIVWQGSCIAKVFNWELRETTVPSKYLPAPYRTAKSAN